jgi:hypothetical protein
MVIPENFRKCVVFLFAPTNPGHAYQPVGTAFIVGIPATAPPQADSSPLRENEGWYIHYLVTARHMVALARQYGTLFARFHLFDGTTIFLEFPLDSWHEHHATDVAAALLRVPKLMDQTNISIAAFELDEVAKQHQVSIGDEVFFMGLFSEHPGAEHNQPIARFGNIALMPGENVSVDVGDSTARIRAYLVEARSWGGHSGSPAFVFFPPDRFLNSLAVNEGVPIFLLGLVQGHYDIEREMRIQGDVGKVSSNAGIAVVVPAQHIYDLVMEARGLRKKTGQPHSSRT